MTFDPIDFGEPSGDRGEPRPERAASRPRSPLGGRRAAAFAVAALVALTAGVMLAVRAVAEPPMDEAVRAFRARRYDAAAAAFRRVLDARGGDDVTAYLYLGRIDRRRQAYAEAAASLRVAARLAPDDPDVNRELGYLFLDLGRPGPAVRRFELALEAEPDADPNWIGLVRALRAARDPRAETVLRRAPDTVRALLATRG